MEKYSLMQHKGLNFEIEQMITSSSTREKIWGIFGVLMQLQQYLMNNRYITLIFRLKFEMNL